MLQEHGSLPRRDHAGVGGLTITSLTAGSDIPVRDRTRWAVWDGRRARGGAPGVRGDEALRHGLAIAAPLLNLDEIEESSFSIPELALTEWSDRARTLVERVTALGGGQSVPNDWGVYLDKRFFWRAPGSYGTTWSVREDEGVTPVNVGEDIAELATEIIGTFTDANGVERAVGPPGSGADVESAELLDTDPLNPVNSSEVPRKTITRDLGNTHPEGAVILARLKLQEALEADRRGSYQIPELPDGKAPYYCWGGDRLYVEDAEDYDGEQPVISTNYETSNGYAEASVGAPPDASEVLMAQLAAASG